MFKRVLILAKPHWLLLLVSILSSVVFVFFNSLSIWLTASFISNILTDFETLLNNQAELLSASERTVNETLKMWTNRMILDTTALGTLKKLCISIFFIFFLKNIFLYLKNFFAGLMQIKVITDLRNSLFDHLFASPCGKNKGPPQTKSKQESPTMSEKRYRVESLTYRRQKRRR